MKLDVYSPCPGGLDNKIKFCCKDMLSALDSIQDQLDGEQPQSALAEIDRQLQQTPDRACLLAMRIEALDMAGQTEEAKAAVNRFSQLFPDNAIAQAYAAEKTLAKEIQLPQDQKHDEAGLRAFRQYLADQQDVAVDAIDQLQTALAACERHIPMPLFAAFGTVGHGLIARRQFLAGFQHLLVQARLISDEDQRYLQGVNAYLADPEVPQFFKSEFRFEPVDTEDTWADEYNAAARLGNRCQWRAALDKLESLLDAHGPQQPFLRGIFMASASLGLTAKAVDTLRQMAEQCQDPLEAIEAEATALELDIYRGMYPQWLIRCEMETDDGNALLERLQSHANVRLWPGDLSQFGAEDAPPPKAVLHILDRPARSDQPIEKREELPIVLCMTRLHGKETDRPARLVWTAGSTTELQKSLTALRDILGDLWQEPVQHLAGMRLDAESPPQTDRAFDSASAGLRASMGSPTEILAERLERWKDQESLILDGKTPRQAAEDPSLKRRLQALLMLLETRSDLRLTADQIESLRSELGLDPIPFDLNLENASGDVPLWRLSRLDVANTATPSLVNFFALALRCRHSAAKLRIGEELLRRQELGEDVQFPVDRIQFVLATTTLDLGEALSRLQKAENMAVKQGRSPAEYLLHELTLHLQVPQQDASRFQHIFQMLTTKYAKEPGVIDQLRAILYQAGLINPDGTPVKAPPTTSSSIVGAPPAEVTPAEIGEQPSTASEAEPAAPSKLWLPGQD